MARIRLKVNGAPVYDCLADISTEYPDTEFQLLAVQPREEGLIEIAEIKTTNGDELIRHFENTPDVLSSEVIQMDDHSVLMRFVVPISELYEALIASGILPQYPLLLQDGWFFAEAIASQKQLSTYTDELTAAGIPYEVLSLTQSYDSSEVLTNRQWQFVTEAIERGYYETPRRCTLKEIADALGINDSAASKLHHRVESRIITEFVERSN